MSDDPHLLWLEAVALACLELNAARAALASASTETAGRHISQARRILAGALLRTRAPETAPVLAGTGEG